MEDQLKGKEAFLKQSLQKAETKEHEVKIIKLPAGKILWSAKLAVMHCKIEIKEAYVVIAAGEAENSEGVQYHMSLQSQTSEGVCRDAVATVEVSNVI